MTLLSVRNLSVAIHEKPIVKDISFNLGAGEILALTGESGSGKSISALALMGLLPLGSKKGGIINFDGNDLNKISENKLCNCLLYTSPSPRDQRGSRMPSSA